MGDPIKVLPVVFHPLWCGVSQADLARRQSDRTVVTAQEPGR
ncbi:hypothetical protein [Streptomyces sp. NPDC004629]